MSSIGPAVRRITLLTDFGTRDGYTGAMRGVIAGIAPDAVVDDISHDIPQGDIAAASWALAMYAHLYPPGTIHVVVVDPGVGSSRRAIAARSGGWMFVAPDNGVLTRVLDGDAEIFEIRERSYRRNVISATFHGRDIFAPAAAHLARGIAIEQLGPRALGAVRLPIATAARSRDRIEGEIMHVDRFGNLVTNIPGAWLTGETVRDAGRQAEHADARTTSHTISVGEVGVRVEPTYAAVPSGELLAYIGSSGFVEVGVRDGSAAARLGAQRGTAVTVLSETV